MFAFFVCRLLAWIVWRMNAIENFDFISQWLLVLPNKWFKGSFLSFYCFPQLNIIHKHLQEFTKTETLFSQ